jgi:glycerol-3-phosphate acyltransferase PlsY
MGYVAAAIAGYLLGSVPVALLVARHHGVDLYATADGNPGAWNALEQLGARRAWPAFAGDGL